MLLVYSFYDIYPISVFEESMVDGYSSKFLLVFGYIKLRIHGNQEYVKSQHYPTKEQITAEQVYYVYHSYIT